MVNATKHDTIINYLLDNWIIAILVILAGIVMAIPQLRDGIKLITEWFKSMLRKEPTKEIEPPSSNYIPCTAWSISKGSRVRPIDETLFQKYGILTVDQIKGEHVACLFGGYSGLGIQTFKISELTQDGIFN
jgi:hypothetical protein|nr:MAG TPA: hypothetical protein [Caudoviricetes sp.]